MLTLLSREYEPLSALPHLNFCWMPRIKVKDLRYNEASKELKSWLLISRVTLDSLPRVPIRPAQDCNSLKESSPCGPAQVAWRPPLQALGQILAIFLHWAGFSKWQIQKVTIADCFLPKVLGLEPFHQDRENKSSMEAKPSGTREIACWTILVYLDKLQRSHLKKFLDGLKVKRIVVPLYTFISYLE